MDKLTGYDAVTDQVQRKTVWLAAHPDCTITHRDHPWEWEAVWPGHPNVIRPELSELLDRLELLAESDQDMGA
jgi:hypothetical protein